MLPKDVMVFDFLIDGRILIVVSYFCIILVLLCMHVILKDMKYVIISAEFSGV